MDCLASPAHCNGNITVPFVEKIFYHKVCVQRFTTHWLTSPQTIKHGQANADIKRQKCKIAAAVILHWGDECQISGNFSVLRHLTCQGKLCDHYRQVPMLYIPVTTSQWQTEQEKDVKIFLSDFPTYFGMCIQLTFIKLLVKREIQL